MTDTHKHSPTVFISYSHDSTEHISRVVALSNRLREEGIDCELDQYHFCPDGGWATWGMNQIRKSDFVMVVCTEIYYNRFHQDDPNGKGAKYEGLIINNDMLSGENREKYIPLVFDDNDKTYIPMPLSGNSFYKLYEKYEDLYRHLTDQSLYKKSDLGEIKKLDSLDPKTVKTDFGETICRDPQNAVLENYKARLLKRVEKVDVYGKNKPFDMNDIYIKVKVLEELDRDQLLDMKRLEEQYDWKHRQFKRTQEAQDGSKIIEENDRVFVWGNAGAGKSTFLQNVAYNYLKKDLNNHPLSLFMRFRDWTEDKPPLYDYIVDDFCNDEAEGRPYIENRLKKGDCILLLDGLDEAGEDVDVAQAIKAIKKLIEKCELCRFVISCRPAATQQKMKTFTHVQMADFEPGQIEQYISNWFEEENELAADCWKELNRDKHQVVLELASIPLLLNMICLIFKGEKDFPPSRSLLFSQAFEILLREWDDDRGVERQKYYENLEWDEREKLLQYLAFHMFEKNQLVAAQSDLAKLISDYLDINMRQSEEVLNVIEAQHALLISRAKKLYSFSHLSFQEYFTAKWIVEEENRTKGSLEKLLNDYLTEPRWRNVFFFTTELLQDKAAGFLQSMRERISGMVSDELKTQLANVNESIKVENPQWNFINRLMGLTAFMKISWDDAIHRKNEIFNFTADTLRDNSMEQTIPNMEVIFNQLKIDNKLYDANKNYLITSKLLFDCLQTECGIDQTKKESLLNGLMIEPPNPHIEMIGPRKEDEDKQTLIIPLPNLPDGAKPLELVLIKPGKLDLGEGNQTHPVHIKYEFQIGKYPITQAQWQAVMGNNPSYFKDNPNNPVESVSWYDCKEFLKKVNQMNEAQKVLQGKPLRLPSEAEWEYACRAGTDTRFYWGDDKDEKEIWNYAWFYNNTFLLGTQEVGKKKPNQFGLYDMSGNVLEWCEDDWHENYKKAPDDGRAWVDEERGEFRVLRGGGWDYSAWDCRSAIRSRSNPDDANDFRGFRVGRTP